METCKDHRCDSEYVYKLNDSYIYPNFQCGAVQLSYWAIPTDDAGFPKIPDQIKFREAVSAHLTWKLARTKMIAGKMPQAIYMEFKHNEAIKNAVESGLGIGCLSQIVLQKNFANGDLVPLQLARRDMRRTFYFALPRKRFHLEPVEAWMSLGIISSGALAYWLTTLLGARTPIDGPGADHT